MAIEPHFVRKDCAGQLTQSQFYLSFWRSNLISCESFARDDLQIVISHQFLAIEPHFVRMGCDGNPEITILPQFLAIEPHFVRKSCAGRLELAILHRFLAIEPDFVRKDCAGQLTQSQFYLSFWRSNLTSCESFARDDLQIAISHQFLAIEPHFVRKGCAGRLANGNFTSVFGDRTSFRAKGLRFVPSRWHCPAPSREK